MKKKFIRFWIIRRWWKSIRKWIIKEWWKKIRKFILDFLHFEDEEALGIQDDVPLIFKTKNGYEEITIKDDEIKDKDLEYYLENLKKNNVIRQINGW